MVLSLFLVGDFVPYAVITDYWNTGNGGLLTWYIVWEDRIQTMFTVSTDLHVTNSLLQDSAHDLH